MSLSFSLGLRRESSDDLCCRLVQRSKAHRDLRTSGGLTILGYERDLGQDSSQSIQDDASVTSSQLQMPGRSTSSLLDEVPQSHDLEPMLSSPLQPELRQLGGGGMLSDEELRRQQHRGRTLCAADSHARMLRASLPPTMTARPCREERDERPRAPRGAAVGDAGDVPRHRWSEASAQAFGGDAGMMRSYREAAAQLTFSGTAAAAAARPANERLAFQSRQRKRRLVFCLGKENNRAACVFFSLRREETHTYQQASFIEQAALRRRRALRNASAPTARTIAWARSPSFEKATKTRKTPVRTSPPSSSAAAPSTAKRPARPESSSWETRARFQERAMDKTVLSSLARKFQGTSPRCRSSSPAGMERGVCATAVKGVLRVSILPRFARARKRETAKHSRHSVSKVSSRLSPPTLSRRRSNSKSSLASEDWDLNIAEVDSLNLDEWRWVPRPGVSTPDRGKRAHARERESLSLSLSLSRKGQTARVDNGLSEFQVDANESFISAEQGALDDDAAQLDHPFFDPEDVPGVMKPTRRLFFFKKMRRNERLRLTIPSRALRLLLVVVVVVWGPCFGFWQRETAPRSPSFPKKSAERDSKARATEKGHDARAPLFCNERAQFRRPTPSNKHPPPGSGASAPKPRASRTRVRGLKSLTPTHHGRHLFSVESNHTAYYARMRHFGKV